MYVVYIKSHIHHLLNVSKILAIVYSSELRCIILLFKYDFLVEIILFSFDLHKTFFIVLSACNCK